MTGHPGVKLPATPAPPSPRRPRTIGHPELMRGIIGFNVAAEDSVISSMICGTRPQCAQCERSRRAEHVHDFPVIVVLAYHELLCDALNPLLRTKLRDSLNLFPERWHWNNDNALVRNELGHLKNFLLHAPLWCGLHNCHDSQDLWRWHIHQLLHDLLRELNRDLRHWHVHVLLHEG